MSIFLCSSLSKGGEQLGFEPDLTLRQKAVYHVTLEISQDFQGPSLLNL